MCGIVQPKFDMYSSCLDQVLQIRIILMRGSGSCKFWTIQIRQYYSFLKSNLSTRCNRCRTVLYCTTYYELWLINQCNCLAAPKELQMTKQKKIKPTSSFSQSRIAAMNNVLADGRLIQKGGGGGTHRPHMYPTPGRAWGKHGVVRGCAKAVPVQSPSPLTPLLHNQRWDF